jgi:hypothetical protein
MALCCFGTDEQRSLGFAVSESDFVLNLAITHTASLYNEYKLVLSFHIFSLIPHFLRCQPLLSMVVIASSSILMENATIRLKFSGLLTV